MRIATKCFYALALTLLACQLAGAQSNPPAELNLTLGEQRVRFAPTRSFQEMRLEVTNSVGEIVFTHTTADAEFDWNLRASNGEALVPGLYRYALTLKFSEDLSRQHSGHFIVEKGQDQIWLTASEGAEVSGTALNATRSGGRSVAGFRTTDDKSVKRDVSGRELVDEKGNKLPNDKDKNKSAKQEKAGVLATQNRIAKFAADGVTVVDSAAFESGGNVGIGTTSPQGALHVFSTAVNPLQVQMSGVPGAALTAQMDNYGGGGASGGSGFLGRAANGSIGVPANVAPGDRLGFNVFGGYAGGAFRHTAAINAFVGSGAVNAGSLPTYLNFMTTPNGSVTRAERMRITDAGNVGINTIAPSARLEVVKSSAAEDATLTTTAFGDSNALIGRSAGGTQTVPTATPADQSLLFLGGRGHTGAGFTFSKAGMNLAASQNWSGASNGARISFDTTANGSTTRLERMRIDHNGNVGIGVTAPEAMLDIQREGVGDEERITVFGDNTRPNVHWRKANGTAAVPTAVMNNDFLADLQIQGHTGSLFAAGVAMEAFAGENWSGALRGTTFRFRTVANGSASLVERLRIHSNGFIGIGTATPASLLDVAGSINADTQYNLGGSRMLSTPGTSNLFVGINAGNTGLTGFSNATFGEEAGQSIADGDRNSFFGRSAGQFTSGGNHNSFFGHTAGRGNDLGGENTFFGYQSGLNNDFGNDNAFFGTGTGLTNTTGDNNTLIGHSANVGSNNLNFATAIGAGAVVSNSNQIQLGGSGTTVRVAQFAGAADNHVCYDILNTLSTCSSSRRYKENIQPMRSGLKLIQQMRPVSFDWIGRQAPSLGLIAEEVAEVEPRLVTHNSTGVIEGIKYDQITAVLVKAVKEQQAQIASLKKLVCRTQRQTAACQPAKQIKRIGKR